MPIPRRFYRTVLFVDGHIQAVQPAGAQVPAGFTSIDAAGQWLMPGLIDLHVHVFDESDLALLLAYGVTTARNMMGLPVHLRFREALEAGTISGPRLIAASPTMNGPVGAYPIHRVVRSPGEARAAVQAAADAGFDLIKIYDGVAPDVFAALVAEARRQKLPVAGHVPPAVPFAEVLAAYASVEHVEELDQSVLHGDESRLPALVAQIRTSGVPVVATLQAFNAVVERCGTGAAHVEGLVSSGINPLIATMSRGGLDHWAAQDATICEEPRARQARFHRIAKALFDGGVPVAFGTDSGTLLTEPGPSALTEVRLLVQAGVPLDAVLESATKGAAAVLGLARDVGRLEPGMIADAMLLAGDPREDLRHLSAPRAVISHGRWYGPAARRALLARSERMPIGCSRRRGCCKPCCEPDRVPKSPPDSSTATPGLSRHPASVSDRPRFVARTLH